MEQFKVKTYMLPKSLKQIWPENKFTYTIEYYDDCRIWRDDIIGLTLFLRVNYNYYRELMRIKFGCVECGYKLFYPTKEQCQEAIKFIDYIKIMNKLL